MTIIERLFPYISRYENDKVPETVSRENATFLILIEQIIY